MLIESSYRALRSLKTPGMFGIIIQTILLTLAALTLFIIAASWLAFYVAANISDTWMSDLIRWGGSAGAVVLAWLLFPGIMPVIVGFYDQKTPRVIEEHDYPGRPVSRVSYQGSEVLHDIGFSIKAVLLNILCLPLYFVPLINIFVFYVLNGYLLGREFFGMVARRHRTREEAERMRRIYARPVFWGGVWFAFLATIPFVNLIAPILGVALFVHLFHQAELPKQPLTPMIS